MADRTVVTAVSPGMGEGIREFEVSGDFITRQAFIRHA